MPAGAAGERLDVGQAAGRVVVGDDRRRRLGCVERQELTEHWSVAGRHGHVVVVYVDVGWSGVHPSHLFLSTLLKFPVTSAKQERTVMRLDTHSVVLNTVLSQGKPRDAGVDFDTDCVGSLF